MWTVCGRAVCIVIVITVTAVPAVHSHSGGPTDILPKGPGLCGVFAHCGLAR